MSPGTLRRGTGSRPLLARSALSSLMLLSAASLPGCDSFGRVSSGGSYDGVEPSGTGGTGAAASGGSPALAVAGTGPSLSISLTPPEPPCQISNVDVPVFADRILSNDAPARRELFTWTTAEQVQELRAGSVLLTRIEREGLGPGYATDVLTALAQTPLADPAQDPAQADSIALAVVLTQDGRFKKARYAWSEPWATRMGWPGETYGDQLVRVLLRQEAWLARYRDGRLDVVDMDNAPVPAADVQAHPERLAGVFFVRSEQAGGPTCYGSFRSGDHGYREFIIANEAMVEEWSLGTTEIRDRLEADLALVQTFFDRVRPCPEREDVASWNVEVVCGWSYGPSAMPQVSELSAYQAALAMLSPGYLPAAQPLATLIEALQASLFEPDPFVVKVAR